MFDERLKRVREILRDQKLDGVLFYATKDDFRTSQWLLQMSCRGVFHYLLVTDEDIVFLELSYFVASTVLPAQVRIMGFPEEDELSETLAEAMRCIRRVGLCGPVPWSHLSWYSGEIVDITSLIYRAMLPKSPDEVREIGRNGVFLRESICGLGEECLRRLEDGQGITELDIERKLRHVLFGYCESLAFPISIATGATLMSGTLGKATDRAIGKEEAICIDAGLVRGGFYSDCTRMFIPKGSRLLECYQILEECQTETIHSLRPGMSFREVGENLKELMKRKGLDGDTLVLEDLGHGIGYSLHEPPFFSKSSYDDWTLLPGMVITLEPEITMYGNCLRIEDMVVITEEGAHRLT